MKQEFIIEGMTCDNCKKKVIASLVSIEGVAHAVVDRENGLAQLQADRIVTKAELEKALDAKYAIVSKAVKQPSTKLKELYPLFLILSYVIAGSIYLTPSPFEVDEFMLNYMALFLIVFSFFKFLDYQGFPSSFANYDPLARQVPIYGKIYPFIETLLGVAFLLRYQLDAALWITVVLLSITTIGVIQSLVNNRQIECACLGTVLKLPMTEATLIENSLMLLMAGGLIFG
ncbi:MAG: heavy-metal-associated domain-containing protein [Flavobacteriaceae bacterium]